VSALRLVIVAAVLALLVRAGVIAWRNRAFGVQVWRSVRPRHVLGSVALLAVVLGVFTALLAFVPVTQYGLGSLVGFDGNAVFAPVEEVAVRAGGTPLSEGGGGTPWWVDAAIVAFLGLLGALLPWLAFGEERLFRLGLERATLPREVWMALRFGLVHLVMLIPVAAALAVAVAGFWYGRVYRGAYARTRARSIAVVGPDGEPIEAPPPVGEARRDALLASTVWHTTFNSIIVVLVMITVAVQG
jgi:hypothetical protein